MKNTRPFGSEYIEKTNNGIFEIFASYLNNSEFRVTNDGRPEYYMYAHQRKNFFGKSDIFLFKDFFTVGEIINSSWNAVVENDRIICESPYDEIFKFQPINIGTKSALTVQWKPELSIFNLMNPALHEEGLIRKISGITYYPLNLFRFTDYAQVLTSPPFKWLNLFLGINTVEKSFIRKTLYYYIDKNKLYVGIWDYFKYMPLDPVSYVIREEFL